MGEKHGTKEIREGVVGLLVLGLVAYESLKDGFQVSDPASIGANMLGYRADLVAAIGGIDKAKAEGQDLDRSEMFQLGHMGLDVTEGVLEAMLDDRPVSEVIKDVKGKVLS